MSFKDIEIKTEYRSGKSNVIGDFYIPVLSHAVKYQRAVGFFSSTALIQIARGISELVSNGGKIQLIVSPRLSKEDIYAIKTGYDRREEIINNAIGTGIITSRVRSGFVAIKMQRTNVSIIICSIKYLPCSLKKSLTRSVSFVTRVITLPAVSFDIEVSESC